MKSIVDLLGKKSLFILLFIVFVLVAIFIYTASPNKDVVSAEWKEWELLSLEIEDAIAMKSGVSDDLISKLNAFQETPAYKESAVVREAALEISLEVARENNDHVMLKTASESLVSEFDPDYITSLAHFNLANLAINENDIALALEHLDILASDEYLDKTPLIAEALFLQASLLEEENVERATEIYERIVDLYESSSFSPLAETRLLTLEK